jgi:hypothetical protein
MIANDGCMLAVDDDRREVSVVELEPIHNIHRGLGPLRFFDGHRPFGTDLFNRARNELTDCRVVMRRNRSHLQLLPPFLPSTNVSRAHTQAALI